MANENGKNVFFISLAATRGYGKPEPHSFIFDLITKLEFKDSNVKALDVLDLLGAYKIQNPTYDTKEITVYDLVEYFVQENSDADVIVDECPILWSGTRTST